VFENVLSQENARPVSQPGILYFKRSMRRRIAVAIRPTSMIKTIFMGFALSKIARCALSVKL
jgi:hypothetical protein